MADIILNDAVPLMYFACWILFVTKSGLRWKDALSWTIFPFIYIAWVLLRGAITGRFPYPFVDAGQIGYARALLNAALLFACFLVAGLVLIAIARWKHPNARQTKSITEPEGRNERSFAPVAARISRLYIA